MLSEQKKARNSTYVLSAILFLLLGVFAQVVAESIPFASQEITELDNGEPVTKKVAKSKVSAKLLNGASVFLFSLSVSILLTIYVSRKIEDTHLINERKSLEEFQKAINQDVFDALLKRVMPDEIFQAVKNQVINYEFLKKDANWSLKFTRLEGHQGKIMLVHTIEHQLVNVSRDAKTYELKANFDNHAGETLLKSVQVSLHGQVVAKRTCHETITAEGKVLLDCDKKIHEEGVSVEDCDGITKVRASISIPANDQVKVCYYYVSVYESDFVNDCYMTLGPIVGATLVVEHPEDYKFGLFQSLATELTPTSDPVHTAGTVRHSYSAEGAILPGQAFVYSLRKSA